MIRSLRISTLFLWMMWLVCLGGIAPQSQQAQELTAFDDPDGKYSLKLPKGWVFVVNQDKVTGKSDVQIVYGIRENGALKIRVIEDVDPKAETTAVAKKDENDSLRFLTGFSNPKVESFLTGNRMSALAIYDFKNTANQPMTGRNYYVRVNDTTVYLLRFTGRPTTLPSLRNQTDLIARSLKLKGAEDSKAAEAKPTTKP
jgi:hypothetical protein